MSKDSSEKKSDGCYKSINSVIIKLSSSYYAASSVLMAKDFKFFLIYLSIYLILALTFDLISFFSV